MDTVKKFQCQRCGGCCKNTRGRLGEIGKKRAIPPFIFEYTSRQKASISLHEWELPVLKEEAKRQNLSLTVVPYLAIWDDINRLPVALNYTLDHDDCPFVTKENICSINDKKPLVCKAYPVHIYGLLNPQPGVKIDINHGDCPNAAVLGETDKLEKIKYSDLTKNLFEVYGASFVGMLQEEAAADTEAEILKEMVKNCEIYPEFVAKDTEILISSKKPIGMLKLVKQKKPRLYAASIQHIQDIYKLTPEYLTKMLSEKRSL
jgi:Fe-S-cluster containining protein